MSLREGQGLPAVSLRGPRRRLRKALSQAWGTHLLQYQPEVGRPQSGVILKPSRPQALM